MTTQSDPPRYGWGFLVVGLIFCTYVAWVAHYLVVPQWRTNHSYAEGRCVLLDQRPVEGYPGAQGSRTSFVDFLIRHSVDGRDYEAWTYDVTALLGDMTALRCQKESVLANFVVGREYPCWYDPADPSQVVLVRGYNGYSYVFLVTFVGLLGFTLWGFFRPRGSVGPAPEAGSGAGAGPGRAGGGSSSRWGDWRLPLLAVLTSCGLVAVSYVLLDRVGGAKWPSSLLCSFGLGLGAYVLLLHPLFGWWWTASRGQPPDGGPPR